VRDFATVFSAAGPDETKNTGGWQMASATRTGLLLGVATIATGLAVTGGPALAQKRGGSLVYANVSAVGTMDPQAAAAVVDLEAIHHVFEGLVEMGEDYGAKPMLASKVDISPDGRVFTFTLRKGVKFHNGKEMTVADVMASFERYKKVSPNAPALADVAAMEAPDPYTFVIKLNKPNSLFVEVMKTPTYSFSIIPAELKDQPGRELEPIGTGPFQMQEWRKDSHLILKRFDGYVADDSAKGPDGYAGKKTAYLDTVRYNSVPEANTRIAALQTGGADFIATIPGDLAKRLQGRTDIKVMSVIPFCQATFITHAKNPPMSTNRQLRQAIASLVDADEMMSAAGQVWDANPSLMFTPWYDQHSVDKAKALLKQGNYAGEKVVLETNANYAYMRDSSQVLVEQMKAAGINVELKMVDWTTNQADLSKGTGGWNMTITGLCSGPLLGPQQWRLSLAFAQNPDDPVVTDGYAKMFATTDPAERKKIWQGIEKYFLEEGYMMKVADIADLRGMNDKFVGIKPYYMQRFWDVWQK
jgi:peptide/nickel transport system substrate-binding protein